MKLKKYAFIIIIFLLVSCSDDSNENINNQNNYAPGVVISFDDDYVDNWVEVHNILEVYDWKATFFVTKFNQLSNDKINKLKDLKNYGHEIGGHGLNHLNATTFIANNGVTEYLNQEIYPMVNLMDNNSLSTTSFAYPYGARSTSTDNILFNNFQILRGTTYGNSAPSSQNCYYSGNRIVFGLGIDKSYYHFSVSYFLSLLQYAKNNNKIVIFYAHKPVETVQADYETEFQTLIEICNYVKNNNMKFYKMSELYNIQNSI
ncbi:polysaccharide deacetylase family protein [Flavobacterium gawalongense]|uniref:Polysaccharide deacetylase family protein n=1 Tax=Flavobacterium gawalongense TaxID=2594432 RepID=A0A553B804_9FLAO|nr:polysaccharide deacetylase family protein [Flavobacterium gawalongense]TRX03471.1 polysaccharide deacetylase family protein [Flavobacterium gawalongense]TRX04390.1 polysaccharide deacetylase family protein [Flavobacterium gawalongense]TRX05100.1 polysaccharide deacetylase family protein [Flavobacterium gawalongense]TRX06760.1 polysaccharide deacetylase family protein [Flavobacterium gawalongense]TRX21010.1 polysaccharide deacetylase family protein [Flavobacterium gawalongense]